MKAIETTALTKRYKDKIAVDALNLTIDQGELFALLGVNGAGKTTTIKMLSCLLRPTSGDALLMGKSIVSQPYEVKKNINVSPQETAIAPNLSVRENLELICGVYGESRSQSKQKAQEIYGYLPQDVLRHIAQQTGVKPAKVFGVATFYAQFRFQPVGKYLIMLCQGTACHVNGSQMIEQAIVEELGIHDGETTSDGLFNTQRCGMPWLL